MLIQVSLNFLFILIIFKKLNFFKKINKNYYLKKLTCYILNFIYIIFFILIYINLINSFKKDHFLFASNLINKFLITYHGYFIIKTIVNNL
jgi:hypothetical protein